MQDIVDKLRNVRKHIVTDSKFPAVLADLLGEAEAEIVTLRIEMARQGERSAVAIQELADRLCMVTEAVTEHLQEAYMPLRNEVSLQGF